MICHRCMRAALRASAETRTVLSRRALSSTASSSAIISANGATSAAPQQGDPSSSHNPPAATSTSAAQPFSARLTPSAANQDIPKSSSKTSQAPPAIRSSCVEGTVLRGLNFIKGKQDPVALADSEYPSWLWEVLNENENSDGAGGVEGDLFSKSKKQRRLAAKALRRQQLVAPELLAPKVPLYEQSIDLPGGDGSVQGAVEAAQAREVLTKAMRGKRRGGIKEDNYLRSMR